MQCSVRSLPALSLAGALSVLFSSLPILETIIYCQRENWQTSRQRVETEPKPFADRCDSSAEKVEDPALGYSAGTDLENVSEKRFLFLRLPKGLLVYAVDYGHPLLLFLPGSESQTKVENNAFVVNLLLDITLLFVGIY